jgi:hypothetical protein
MLGQQFDVDQIFLWRKYVEYNLDSSFLKNVFLNGDEEDAYESWLLSIHILK